jgi:mannose-6-phosphate isomerase-like protein (cupin superfamily)
MSNLGGSTGAPRRVITGHDESGKSVFLTDGPTPVVRHLAGEGVSFFEIWNTGATPAPVAATEDEPTQLDLTVPPAPNGTKIRINEFLPGHLNDRNLQSPVHRTESIDYGIVLEGEIVLVLDDSEVTLRAGDVVVQRGTSHAWANRTNSVARMAFILVDGSFTPELLSSLPADEHVMRGGPDDSRENRNHE